MNLRCWKYNFDQTSSRFLSNSQNPAPQIINNQNYMQNPANFVFSRQGAFVSFAFPCSRSNWWPFWVIYKRKSVWNGRAFSTTDPSHHNVRKIRLGSKWNMLFNSFHWQISELNGVEWNLYELSQPFSRLGRFKWQFVFHLRFISFTPGLAFHGFWSGRGNKTTHLPRNCPIPQNYKT